MTQFQDRAEKLSQRVASALGKLPKEPTAKYVHRLRTLVRRIESLVDYARPDLGRKQQKALEKLAVLRKRAGKVRDLDVQAELLKEIANGSTASDRRSIGDALEQKRDKQARRLMSAAAKIADSKFLSHIERMVAKSAAAGSADQRDPLAEARKQLAGPEREFATRVSHKPAELHRMRIQMKKIRYVAELAADSPEQRNFVEQLRAVQDALGAWHDWQELAKTAEKQFRNRMNCPLLVEVRALLAAKQVTASAAVRQLFARHPELPSSKQPQSATSTRELLRHAG